ncbi:MAG: hypothetical protein DRI80_10460 [Chloroflexota bacterium]|nr:MAG: hypothetical protein DRI80_10460 [Chloroflexota bacterium]
MASEAKTMAVPRADVLRRLDRLIAEMSAVREELSRLEVARPPSAQVVEWAQKVNAAINDQTLSPEERMEVINSVPAPLRHAVAAECYRTNENVTFGWAATIAGVLSFEVPDLLRAHGVEPEFA